jgi:hypothetical protein
MNTVKLGASNPVGIPKSQRSAVFNNDQARAFALGDTRGALKRGNLIRPGLSIGRAQTNQAGIAGATDMSESLAQSYARDLESSAYDANARLQQDVANRQFAQGLSGLQQQQRFNAQSNALQRQNSVLGLYGGLLGGLLK